MYRGYLARPTQALPAIPDLPRDELQSDGYRPPGFTPFMIALPLVHEFMYRLG